MRDSKFSGINHLRCSISSFDTHLRHSFISLDFFHLLLKLYGSVEIPFEQMYWLRSEYNYEANCSLQIHIRNEDCPRLFIWCVLVVSKCELKSVFSSTLESVLTRIGATIACTHSSTRSAHLHDMM